MRLLDRLDPELIKKTNKRNIMYSLYIITSVAIVEYGISVVLNSQPYLQGWIGQDRSAIFVPFANASVKLTAYIEHFDRLANSCGMASINLQLNERIEKNVNHIHDSR